MVLSQFFERDLSTRYLNSPAEPREFQQTVVEMKTGLSYLKNVKDISLKERRPKAKPVRQFSVAMQIFNHHYSSFLEFDCFYTQ